MRERKKDYRAVIVEKKLERQLAEIRRFKQARKNKERAAKQFRPEDAKRELSTILEGLRGDIQSKDHHLTWAMRKTELSKKVKKRLQFGSGELRSNQILTQILTDDKKRDRRLDFIIKSHHKFLVRSLSPKKSKKRDKTGKVFDRLVGKI